jgi:hypothetical protein
MRLFNHLFLFPAFLGVSCVVAQGVPPGRRGPEAGSRRAERACMAVASSCVCCKPVAEGGASVGLRVLRGARKRNIIRYEDQETQFGADATWTGCFYLSSLQVLSRPAVLSSTWASRIVTLRDLQDLSIPAPGIRHARKVATLYLHCLPGKPKRGAPLLLLSIAYAMPFCVLGGYSGIK